MDTALDTDHRELDSRTVDGITVVILWRPGDAGVLLRVDDAKTGVRFELDVPGEDAREAFQHPFAYAANPGMRTPSPNLTDRADSHRRVLDAHLGAG